MKQKLLNSMITVQQMFDNNENIFTPNPEWIETVFLVHRLESIESYHGSSKTDVFVHIAI